MNEQTNQLTPLTADEIGQRVQTTNRFTRAELDAYRPQIRQARADKKARLAAMTPNHQTALVAGLHEDGLTVLHDVRRTVLKSGAKQATIVLRDPPKPRARKVTKAALRAVERMSAEDLARALPPEVLAQLLERATSGSPVYVKQAA